jgi:AhpD family alkylhydroperoxidase
MTVTDSMSPHERLSISELQPAAYSALAAFDRAATDGLPPSLVHLVKLRTSRVNGCTYCIALHSKEARAAGETEERLGSLTAWREGGLFDDRERAALA